MYTFYCDHIYTSISPLISFGSRRSRACLSLTFCSLFFCICKNIGSAYSANNLVIWPVGLCYGSAFNLSACARWHPSLPVILLIADCLKLSSWASRYTIYGLIPFERITINSVEPTTPSSLSIPATKAVFPFSRHGVILASNVSPF